MLYVVMLGGRHPRASIEVHDVVFTQADSLEHAYPQLRQAWFGSQAGLHIDSWWEVDGIDTYRVELSPMAPAPHEPRLFFINLGGYERDVFGEAHRYLLVVARDKAQARQLGKRRMPAEWLKSHTDTVLEVDDCLPVDWVNGHYVHLVAGTHKGIRQCSDYIRI
ncbi:DUF1543 domain-containing protein [Pseudomonas corrugata]|uniref:DUF1543 domain-containing protein n=1 Tax=Pseudomonas corrugata TaxID=47879 RepID=A0A3M3ENV4_9PSED|nr:DUF1543 domain-containing protein [Pseudomonas corrugata]AOE61152.1 hypothetical protein AXG94_04990 [Pseudomonas corrugata]MDU9023339.1 DUF1543 domain-containing protein [Pseudomonas corrugata]MDU9032913.1 DUF1543 domain-containing protein [Pseudomonas corrugata]MDU9038019.1 DUF1543 domain-containing protein [Pseudomonas corrugata]QTH12307.1 DUF1543 domain-containing protein [Pseudomonas corrugata]